MDFLPSFGSFGLTIAAFVVALSVIVAVHEYGHYIVGRWTGIKADVFSVGFGPILFKRTDRHGTQWQVAALPFGGYVKFRGDANAASAGADTEAMNAMSAADRRQTMHGAPLWARAATVAAGPIFNFILAFLIFTGFALTSGVATEEARIGAVVDAPESVELLQENDLVLEVDGTPVNSLAEFVALAEGPTERYTIERDGQRMVVDAAGAIIPSIGNVTLLSAAGDAGIEPGDYVVSVAGVPIDDFNDIRPLVDASGGDPIEIGLWRAGETLTVTLEPRMTGTPTPDGGFEDRFLIGIGASLFFEPYTEPRGLGGAITAGAQSVVESLRQNLRGIGAIITGQIGTCNLQGVIRIAEVSGEAAERGPDYFISIIAGLSLMIGLVNLLPIPVLDGGHLVFHAYEAIARRPPSEKAMRMMMSVGLTLLLSLMVFALLNDLFC
ncbi:MAG: RIP metalloprotease RseP [Pseudomonadota bacterium]